MKMKPFILIATLSFSLLSCQYLGLKSSSEDEASVQASDSTDNEAEALLTLPKTKAFYTGLLESFFLEHYSECFPGSTYKEGSCSVIKLVFSGEPEEGDTVAAAEAKKTSAEPMTKGATSDGEDEVEVVGTHTYVGKGGYDVTGQKFKAIISIAEEGFNIDVYRESTQILTSKSFWEQGAGNFVYVQ